MGTFVIADAVLDPGGRIVKPSAIKMIYILKQNKKQLIQYTLKGW